MDHYQVRLRAEFGVNGLAMALGRDLEACFGRLGLAWKDENPLSLPDAVRGVLERHLVAYDACGSSCICDESVSPVPWNVDPDPRLLSSDPRHRDSLMRVQFRFSADEFYRFTAFLARMAASRSDVSDERAALAQEELEKTVFTAFSAFLFDAPLCHQRELCKDAQAIDLWGGIKGGSGALG
jgi:hypothetical protein